MLAVLSANRLKDLNPTGLNTFPKPPPPRKRPFMRSIFRRWCANNSTDNSSIVNRPQKQIDNSLNISSLPSVNNIYPENNGIDSKISTIPSTYQMTNHPSSVYKSSHVSSSLGGVPIISPPSDMKHVVHVDSDWLTGQGLCESTMRSFHCKLLLFLICFILMMLIYVFSIME